MGVKPSPKVWIKSSIGKEVPTVFNKYGSGVAVSEEKVMPKARDGDMVVSNAIKTVVLHMQWR